CVRGWPGQRSEALLQAVGPRRPDAADRMPEIEGRESARERGSGGSATPGRSGLAHELRLQAHLADAVDPAVDVVVALDQADVAHPGADLHHLRRSLDLQ